MYVYKNTFTYGFLIRILLEVLLPYEPVCPSSVGCWLKSYFHAPIGAMVSYGYCVTAFGRLYFYILKGQTDEKLIQMNEYILGDTRYVLRILL